ncbi:MAG: DDE-type integrase/transposase/recombinase [Verrucomicrobiales bacterium]|nr:DDE-type integrase/transposase/recombinase [Verrucomicrobiales bacterium]
MDDNDFDIPKTKKIKKMNPDLIFDKTSSTSSSKEKIKASEADIETEWDGTQSAKKLHQMMKAKGYRVSLKQIQEVMKGDEVSQLFKRITNLKSKYSPIISPNKLHVVQMDLVDMTKQGKRFNKGNGFMMTAIDVWSRYAYATPCKNKTTKECMKAFKLVLENLGTMKNLTTDLESAFNSSEFKKLYKEKGITHWRTNPERKRNMMIVERFHRTLRELMVKRMRIEDTNSWVSQLPRVLNTYNNQPHSGIGEVSPIDVWEKKTQPKYKSTTQQVRTDLKVGDNVRYRLELALFEKKSMAQQWSSKVYKIKAINGNNFTIENDGQTLRKKGYQLLEVPLNTKRVFKEPSKTQIKQIEESNRQQQQRRLNKEGLNQIGDTRVESGLKSTRSQSVKLKDDISKKNIVKGQRETKAKAAQPKAKAKKKKKEDTFLIDYFIHIFKNDILLKWQGYPLSEATREKKSKLESDLGTVQYKALIKDLKNNKKERDEEYNKWKSKA